MLFGAHVSVAEGYGKSLDHAVGAGCECMQIFAKSPRQWVGPPIDAQAARRFEDARMEACFGPLFTHTAYLINLATSDPVIRVKSIEALADELIRARQLGAAGVVTHVGTDPESSPHAAAARVSEAVLRSYDLAGSDAAGTRLLLENSAGAGRSFGASFDELGACIHATGLPAETLGICIDTCHAFAYGMPVDSAQGWHQVVGAIQASIGLDRVGLFHPNDCRFERGSRRDRHEWVGDGFIGREGFAALVCRPEFEHVSACVEIAGDVAVKDTENVARLKRLREECAPSQTSL